MGVPTLEEFNSFAEQAKNGAIAAGHAIDLIEEAAEYFGITYEKAAKLGAKFAGKMNTQRGGYTMNLNGTSFSPKEEVITPKKKSASTRKDDDLFKRARRDGDEAVLNAIQTRPTRMSLGKSITMNNTSFIHELLNRRTTIKVCGGFHYNATTGKRAWHMQHFRHNVFNDNIGNDKAYEYGEVTLGEAGADSTVALINPSTVTYDNPDRVSAFKPVNVQADGNGATDQYCPFSLVDLENVSYNLQGGKNMVAPTKYINVPTAPATATTDSSTAWVHNKALMSSNSFASRSRIFQHNQYIGDDTVASTNNPVIDNNIKCKPVLLGGKVEYQFMNTGARPASITIVVYKVKSGWQDPIGKNGNFTPGYLKDTLLKTMKQAYLDKGQKIRLKTMGGRVPVETDVADDTHFQFLPNLKPIVAAATPFVEQMRYNVIVAGGETKSISISLPGRMYDPTSLQRSRAETYLVNSENTHALSSIRQYSVGNSRPEFWTKEQYSVAIGVAGCRAVQQFSETGNTSVREGITTTEAEVTCRVKYTERIGAMNMCFQSKPTIGADTFDPPTKTGNSNLSTVALLPVADVVRPCPENGVLPI